MHSNLSTPHKASRRERVLSTIKTSIVSFWFVSAFCVLFFWLYGKSGLDVPMLKPIMFGLIALYLLLEIVIIIGTFWVDQ